MLEKEAAKAKKFGKGMVTAITFLIIAGAAFQIHRLWRASLIRAVNKYSARDSGDSNILDRSTANAPANDDSAPGAGAEPKDADAQANGATN